MKHLMILATIVFAAQLSQAKTICNVNAGSGKDMVYDRTLLSTEATLGKYILISKDKSSASEVQLSQFGSLEKWQAINGLTLITVSEQKNGTYGITAGKVDTAKTSNILPMTAVALGTVRPDQFLTLILPQANLSVVCMLLD
jgi:hypothetical protein